MISKERNCVLFFSVQDDDIRRISHSLESTAGRRLASLSIARSSVINSITEPRIMRSASF